MSFKDNLLKYAERELELVGFMNSPIGQSCLDFLENCANISDENPEAMKHICAILPKLIDLKPISPITEKDFELETYPYGDSFIEIKRCSRYFYLYQMPDGKYYDDRYQAFLVTIDNQTHKMYLYQEKNNSKHEVELPYFPDEKLVNLSK